MERQKFIAMAFVASLALLSCGGDDDEPTPAPQPPTPVTPTGKHLTLSCDLPAPASEKTVTLTGLSAAIDRQSGSASWLTVTKAAYTSGAPQVTVAATENIQTSARQQDVTFYSQRDTLVLTVRQGVYAGDGTDVNSTTDTTTDQPAYSRQKIRE